MKNITDSLTSERKKCQQKYIKVTTLAIKVITLANELNKIKKENQISSSTK